MAPITSAPLAAPARISTVGRRTVSTISAPLTASAAVAVTVAPAFWYSASGKRAALPAPASIDTVLPSPISFWTVSGVAATRVSPSARSRTIAIFMEVSRSLRSSGRLQGDGSGRHPLGGEQQPGERRHQTDQDQDHADRPRTCLNDAVETDHDEGELDDRPFDQVGDRLPGLFVLGVVHRLVHLFGFALVHEGFVSHGILGVQVGSAVSSSPIRRSIIESPSDQKFGSRASSPKGLSNSE